jgi:predicted Zn-dependent peptidase
MFQGSENHKDEYFRPFELVGATDQNGTTWFDRTNYFETVPTTALDMALWMESDRMGHLLGAIGQKELDEQRGVVQNEKRQGENQPYGRVEELMLADTFPANHPYHHSTIGSMADLNAASLADVKQWFRGYYGAANTVIVLAGDITPAQAKAKVMRYFGDIPAGPAVSKPQPWTAARTTSTRDQMTDTVPQVRLYREWNVPGLASPDLVPLQLAAQILGGSKTSRLYQRLVYQDKLADGVSASVEDHVLASMFTVQVDVKQGADPAKVEAAIGEVMKEFLAKGPTADELERAKTGVRAAFIRGLERVNTQATVLAESEVYQNDPTAWRKDYDRMLAATPGQVDAAARKWLSRGDYTLTVSPGKVEATDAASAAGLPAAKGRPGNVLSNVQGLHAVPSGLDRSSGVPVVNQFPGLSFPAIQRGQLKNGIPVLLAERHDVPVVQIALQFDAGYAADAIGKPGVASFTLAMLDEGAGKLDSVQIAEQQQRLGAIMGFGCGLDTCTASLNALDDKLAPSLALFSDIVEHPAFREPDLQRVRGVWLAGIAQEKSQPVGIALRTLPPLLYGSGHPYAIPFTGSGTPAVISALTPDDLRAFQNAWLRPDKVKIIVTGDTTLAKILPQLDAVFGDWATTGPAGHKSVPMVAAQAAPRVFLINRPGSPQSLILAGSLAPPTNAPNRLEIGTMNDAFGGSFTSRLNMNLREDKHWAYGAFSFLQNANGQRPFLMYAPVQTDKTAESIAELLKEANAVVGDKPLTDAEIAKIKANDVRSMPGAYQTGGAVMGELQRIAQYGYPDNEVATRKARIEAQTDPAVNAAAKEVVHPDQLTWVVVGDLAKIEAPIRALNLGPIVVLDADGTPVATPMAPTAGKQ